MSAGRHQRFESVAMLELHELRELLRDGDATERAWAGWAMALRIGKAASPELSGVARAEPTPGVRSLLIVVLAGNGERALLEWFARDDPDPDVRASACRYLLAITPASDVEVDSLLTERLGVDPSSVVRAEILRARLDRHRPAVSMAQVERHLDDDDLRVRTLVADIVLEGAAEGSVSDAMVRRAIDEPDDELRARIARHVLDGGGAERLVEALARTEADVPRIVEVLDAAATTGARQPWHVLRAFVELDPAVDTHIVRLVRVPAEAPTVSWLLSVAARWPEPSPPVGTRASWERERAVADAHRRAWVRLGDVLPTTLPATLSADDLLAVERIIRTWEATPIDDEDDDDASAEPRVEPPFVTTLRAMLATRAGKDPADRP